MEQDDSLYSAFVSYASPDRRWAQRVQLYLERYVVPKELRGRQTEFGVIERKLGKVFRDRSDLSAASRLDSALEKAIERSKAMIVICSPDAAASVWVAEEILTFKRLKPGAPVLPLIVSGEPHGGEFECYPRPLKFEIDHGGNLTEQRVDPLGADARSQGEGWTDARLKLVAGLLGLESVDELKKRELRAARARTRFAAGIALSMSVLAIGAVAAGYTAIQQAATAQKRLTQAIEMASSRIDDAVDYQDRYGMPSMLGLELLDRAGSDFAELLDDVDDEPSLVFARAEHLTAFSRHALMLGDDATKQLKRLDAAAGLLSDLEIKFDESASSKNLFHAFVYSWAPEIILEILESRITAEDLAEAEGNVLIEKGVALSRLGRDDESKKALLDALKLADHMFVQNPGEIYWPLAGIEAINFLSDVSYYADDLRGMSDWAEEANTRLDDIQSKYADIDLRAERFIVLTQKSQAAFELGNVKNALKLQENAVLVAEDRKKDGQDDATILSGLAGALVRLGNIYISVDNVDEARSRYTQSITLFEELLGVDPARADWQRELAVALERDGNAAVRDYDRTSDEMSLEEAESRYERMSDLRSALVSRDPGNIQHQRELSIAHARLGDIARIKRDHKKAADLYRKALKIRQRNLESDPTNEIFVRDVVVSLQMLAKQDFAANQSQRVKDAGRVRFEKACTLLASRAKRDPHVPAFKRDVVLCHANFGEFLFDADEPDLASVEFELAHKKCRELVQQFSENALKDKWLRDCSWIKEKMTKLTGSVEK